MRVGIDCRKIADFGIGTYVRGLVRALAELGGEEEYVLFVPSSLRTALPFQHVIVDAPHYSARELWMMGRAIARAGLDVFHAPHFVLPWTSCPSIATIHDVILAHFPPPQPGGSLYYAGMMRRALRKSVRILTVSEAAKRSIVETFPCDPGKITVTPNGIEPIFFEPGPAASELGRYFLYVGNDKPHKNVSAVVGAFHAVEGASLVLTGADFGRYRGFPGILTPGFVTIERLAELYRGAVAVVVPSLEEGFGLPAAEAMACGTPVIASRIASLVEVAGDAALYVDPTPADTATTGLRFAEAMNRMLREPALRGELSARGRARAVPFTWRRCAELTRQAYRSVVEA